MKTLIDYREYIGKIVSATSANDYSRVTGRCINVRECISDYTDIGRGIRYLADIDTGDLVRVGLANTLEIVG